MTINLVTIVGARPQFVKAAVVSRAIAAHNASAENSIKEAIVHTGQHFDDNMSRVFFDELLIPAPDYSLGIQGLAHGAMTGRMLEKIEGILLHIRPDLVLVYGDTNSTLAGALAASKLHIPVAHVEAGLRSYNRRMPEEINRVLTDHLSSLLFCPTEQSVKNLGLEGIGTPAGLKSERVPTVFNVGDVMLDAAMFYADHARPPRHELPDRFILATVHRAENTDSGQRLKSIWSGLNRIGSEVPVILPIHPRTRQRIQSLNLEAHPPRLQLIEPVGYLEMVYLLSRCSLVMTDSGGLQKESYFFRKPCVTLREETEWVELVEAEANCIGGWDSDTIYGAYRAMSNRKVGFEKKLYGNGQAGTDIVATIARYPALNR